MINNFERSLAIYTAMLGCPAVGKFALNKGRTVNGQLEAYQGHIRDLNSELYDTQNKNENLIVLDE